jgi:hypothetical protein
MEGPEGWEPDDQKQSEGDYRNPWSNALHGQEFGPINLDLLDQLGECVIQIAREQLIPAEQNLFHRLTASSYIQCS